MQSSINSLKSQGVILESEVSSVQTALSDILKDNLKKMGSKEELKKADDVVKQICDPNRKTTDEPVEPDLGTVEARVMVVDLTPKKSDNNVIRQSLK